MGARLDNQREKWGTDGNDYAYKKAITDLVNIYAEVDVLTMKMCAAWLPKAPDRHAKLEMAEQIGKEWVHYLSQIAWYTVFFHARWCYHSRLLYSQYLRNGYFRTSLFLTINR